MAYHQKKIIRVDDHLGAGIAGLTSGGGIIGLVLKLMYLNVGFGGGLDCLVAAGLVAGEGGE